MGVTGLQCLTSWPRQLFALGMMGALALLLACGGGGGGVARPDPAPPVTTTPTDPPPPVTTQPDPPPAPPSCVVTPSQTFPRTDDLSAACFPEQPTAAEFATRKVEFETAEYAASSEEPVGLVTTTVTSDHLETIKASSAYARGATGEGQTVVVVDSGINAGHREFSDGRVEVVTGIGNSCSPSAAQNNECSDPAHGTAVASVIAAQRGSPAGAFDMHGVAFDAQIKFIPIRLSDSAPNPSRPPTRPLNGYTWDPAARAFFDDSHTFRQYIAEGEIINFSFGFPWALSEWRTLGDNCGDIDETGPYACYRYYHRPTVTALAQADDDPADRSIFVIAAGNENGGRHDRDFFNDRAGDVVDATSPTADGAFAVAFDRADDPDLEHILNVVAVGADGEISSYSNRCGLAKDFCIAAPGGDFDTGDGRILVAHSDGSYRRWLGTSFAAPIVSGSLAVLREYFTDDDGVQQLGNTELVTRLLATADRTDIYADSDIYGHGLLDLDAATAPVGTVAVTVSAALDGPRVAAQWSALTAAAPFGDAFAHGLGAHTLAAFDELDAPFALPLAAFVKPARAPRRALTARVFALGDDPRGLHLRVPRSRFGHETILRARFATARNARPARAPDAFAGGTANTPRTFRAADVFASGATNTFASGAANAFASRALHNLGTPWARREMGAARRSRVASFSLATNFGASETRGFFGLRENIGWNFGLHAAGALKAGQLTAPAAFTAPWLALAQDGVALGVETPIAGGALRLAAFHGNAQWNNEPAHENAHSDGALFEFAWKLRAPQKAQRSKLSPPPSPSPPSPPSSASPSLRTSPPSSASPSSPSALQLEPLRASLSQTETPHASPSPHAARVLGVSLQLGVVRESERALGAGAEGAFGALRGATLFGGATAHWPLAANWRAFAAAHAGYTRATAPKKLNLVEGVTPLVSSAFGVGLARANWLRAGDQLTLAVTQPLRVERGRARLHWAVGRTRYGELTRTRHAFALAPTGRQFDFTLAYARAFATGELTLAALATREPGHNATRAPEYTFLLRYAREF